MLKVIMLFSVVALSSGSLLSAATIKCKECSEYYIVVSNITKDISQVKFGRNIYVRTGASKKLAIDAIFFKNKKINEKLFGEVVSLLDFPDDSVRYWVARAIGNLGASGRPAVPRLKKLLSEVDCLPGSKTSASGIRFALSQMGVPEPPHQKCTYRY
ncbi:MAG: hypothetical protein V4472_03145 [Pseudomonadota bacterium]